MHARANYLTELNAVQLQQNFEAAHEHLKQVFSKYPRPNAKTMEGCPCCVSAEKRESLNQGDLKGYLWQAMSTWGSENDFKHYIPQLFSFVYLENLYGDNDVFLSKFNCVENWIQEELQAISLWFNAYAQYKYTSTLMVEIEKSRLKVQSWLENHNQNLSYDFPFLIFFHGEFSEMIPFLHRELIEQFAELLDIWPRDETDFIAYASCLTNYLIFTDCEYGIFEKKVAMWISKNEKMIEELFWKTSDPRLQQLFSDALSPNLFPTSFLNDKLRNTRR